jgi:hypothetical protein
MEILMNLIMILGVLLVASLGGNAFLFDAVGEAREQVTLANERRRDAVDAAELCSASVDSLRIEGDERRKRGQAAVDAARKAASVANSRADRERNRLQAVPGDACASAQVETREWLLQRQGGAK